MGPRTRLATLILQTGVDQAAAGDALAVLGTAQDGVAAGVEGGGVEAAGLALSIRAVAQAVQSDEGENVEDGTGGKRRTAQALAQRAIMMRPSAARGWQTLAYVRCR